MALLGYPEKVQKTKSYIPMETVKNGKDKSLVAGK